ncbi:protein kinase-like protein 2 [Elsinoe australis]|uniref:Protein kinase-like protein 2 n=1 Tax=Elsinoe australis TaxID=40998 RepID=A0A4U7BDM8_9PEZI|nr:protein kinase-like protein 2 [Elsinoe australis]
MTDATFQQAVSRLQVNGNRTSYDTHTVTYLGYQRREGYLYLLSEAVHGGTLQNLIRNNGSPLPMSLVRTILRSLVRWIIQLQTVLGYAVIFLDTAHVFMDEHCLPKIQIPVLDINLAGYRLRPTFPTLPEIVLGRSDLRKANVWLLEIIAAQLLSGRADLVSDYREATASGSQIEQDQKQAIELLLSGYQPSDQTASDFLVKCLTVEVNERPSISDPLDHPFLADGGTPPTGPTAQNVQDLRQTT